jgi:hypothetical protein
MKQTILMLRLELEANPKIYTQRQDFHEMGFNLER